MLQNTSGRPRKRQRTSSRRAAFLCATIATAASLIVAVSATDGGAAQGIHLSSPSRLLSTSQNRPGVKVVEEHQADDEPVFLVSRSRSPTDDGQDEASSLRQGGPPLLIARQASPSSSSSTTGVKTGAFSAISVAATAALGDGLASLVVSSAAIAPTGWTWGFPAGGASASATGSASAKSSSASAISSTASVGTDATGLSAQGSVNSVAPSGSSGATDVSQGSSGSEVSSSSGSGGSNDASAAGGISGASGAPISSQQFKALQQEPGVQMVAAQPVQAVAVSPAGKRRSIPDVIRKAVDEATLRQDNMLERRIADEATHVLDVASLPFEHLNKDKLRAGAERRGHNANARDEVSSVNERATELDTILPTDPKSWLRANVNLYRNTIASGVENLAFVDDPISPMGSPSVLRVFYEQGSYSLHSGSDGGANFYSQPFLTAASSVASSGTPYTTVDPAAANASDPSRPQLLLTYSVYFPQDFDFVKGGKLPGLYSSVGSEGSDGSIDANTDGCSGGSDQGTGASCWSVRVMWRTGGMGEVYAYIPLKLSGGYDLCAGASSSSSSQSGSVTPDSIICNSGDYGTSIGRGAFTFMRGQWNQVSLYVQVNSPHTANGVVRVFVNGSPVPAIDKSGLAFRTGTVATVRTGSGGGSGGSNSKRDVYDASNQKWVDKIFFSTFFGGSSQDFASSQNTTSYFKDFSFFAGDSFSSASGQAFNAAGALHPPALSLPIVSLYLACFAVLLFAL